jgi:glutaredoxin
MVTLFSTGCPKCRVLEQKLNAKNIDFIKSSDIQEVIDQGFMSVPVLKINDKYYDFKQGVDWINNEN